MLKPGIAPDRIPSRPVLYSLSKNTVRGLVPSVVKNDLGSDIASKIGEHEEVSVAEPSSTGTGCEAGAKTGYGVVEPGWRVVENKVKGCCNGKTV